MSRLPQDDFVRERPAMSENVVPAIAAQPVDPLSIRRYHAHVYYGPGSTGVRAAALRERVAGRFPAAVIGHWHDESVGPHTKSMYQIALPAEVLASFLPWLMLNRDGLTILLHPETGDPYADHTDHAVWFGAMLPLRLDVLRTFRPVPMTTIAAATD
jgi:aromatic ring-cleaving dioxygenase